jgi:hypothetical protein
MVRPIHEQHVDRATHVHGAEPKPSLASTRRGHWCTVPWPLRALLHLSERSRHGRLTKAVAKAVLHQRILLLHRMRVGHLLHLAREETALLRSLALSELLR